MVILWIKHHLWLFISTPYCSYSGFPSHVWWFWWPYKIHPYLDLLLVVSKVCPKAESPELLPWDPRTKANYVRNQVPCNWKIFCCKGYPLVWAFIVIDWWFNDLMKRLKRFWWFYGTSLDFRWISSWFSWDLSGFDGDLVRFWCL